MSQLHVGVSPNASSSRHPTTRLSPRVIAAVSEVESGITIRGNRIFRTSPSFEASERSPLCVVSWKNWNRMMLIISIGAKFTMWPPNERIWRRNRKTIPNVISGRISAHT